MGMIAKSEAVKALRHAESKSQAMGRHDPTATMEHLGHEATTH